MQEGEFSVKKLVDSLSKSELKKCLGWIRSRYEDKRQDIPQLFEALMKVAGVQTDAKSLLENAIKNGHPVNDRQFRKAISILKKDVEEFLVIEAITDDRLQYQLTLSQIYRKRGLEKLFKQSMRNLRHEISVSDIPKSFKYFNQYKAASEQYELDAQMKRQKFNYLQEMTDDLTHFYVLEMLKRACHLKSHQSIMPTEYEIQLIDRALEFAQRIPLGEDPSFHIYYWIYMAGEEESDGSSFHLLSDALEKYWQFFSSQEIRDIYLLSINHCIKQLNQGSKYFLEEAFRLYQSALSKNVLYENGKLTPFTYKNVVSIALALGEKEWAYEFLHKQKEYLHSHLRENTFAANLATYYYKVGQFEDAMDLLQKVRFRDPYDNLQYRTLLMRIYYQLGEDVALEHHLESFASYLYRHKNLGYHRGLYQNLLKTMRKMMRSDLRNKQIREELYHEVLSHGQLAEKSWLLTQLESN